MKPAGYLECYVLTIEILLLLLLFNSCSPWRAICLGKKLVLHLVNQVDSDHSAPSAFYYTYNLFAKGYHAMFQLSVHRKGLHLLPVFFDLYLIISSCTGSGV